MAASLVRREGVFPLARIARLQDARACSALSLSLLFDLPCLSGPALPARIASV